MEKVPLTAATPTQENSTPMSKRSLKELEEGQHSDTAKTAPRSTGSANNQGNTLFFRDGARRIDYILAYVEGNNKSTSIKRKKRRKEFELQLRQKGIDIEHEPPANSTDGRTGFVKLHGTWSFMETQAEALKVRMPLKVADIKIRSELRSWYDKCCKWNPFELKGLANEESTSFTAVYDRRYSDQFEMKDKDTFFTSAQRSRMLWEALIRTEYEGGFGIRRLIDNGTYETAYPLHEEFDEKKSEKPTNRQILWDNWARPKRFYKYQPIGLIRDYFGEKVAIYFAWLGFYTKALIPAAIAGVACIIFGGVSIAVGDEPSDDICKGLGNTDMCPSGLLTDTHANISKLSESCLYSQFTYAFDNNATVLFAVFMSIWATMFLEYWKRKQAELSWDWDMYDADMEEEALRPEYVSGVKTEREPYLPLSTRMVRLIGSFTAVIFFLCVVLAFVIGVIIYRMTVYKFMDKIFKTSEASVATAVTAACITLVIIVVLDVVYQYLAWYLTAWEFPRTDQDFEDSYTFKVFLFQFINYYSALFYIAFFKGRWSSIVDAKKITGTLRPEPCDPAGCMVELSIQLAIVMVGKQFGSNVLEIALPMIKHYWRRRRAKPGQTKDGIVNSRWEKDYHLNEVPEMAMFFEYLEMVLQYGFITLFVPAFPLAPLFALINNIMEIRLDAYKFLGTYRRPMPARAKDLGVWYRILDAISHLAVIMNASVIAFTSDFVPRMFYLFYRSPDRSLVGYMDYSLAYYDMRPECSPYWEKNDTSMQEVCGTSNYPIEFCRFREYRVAPCSLNGTGGIDASRCDSGAEYPFTQDWWHIMVARLAFVLIFEHVVFLFKGIMAYAIPDVPRYIVVQMQREQHLAKQALYNRAYVVAGTTDAEPSSELSETSNAVTNGKSDRGGQQHRPSLFDSKGSTPSLARSEFGFNPVDSGDSSGDDVSNKKKKKLTRL